MTRSCVLAVLACLPLAAQIRAYDVIVVGAGSGGVSAAIQAARMGASVALLEETDWVGGQMTAAAVPTMDEQRTNLDSGIYQQFIARVKQHYAKLGKGINTCYWSDHTNCFEPKVGQQILLDLIRETGRIDLLLRKRIDRVLNRGKTVTGVITADGITLSSKVLIDATEYGDVLPLTPAGFRTGKYGPTHIDPDDCIQWLTYCAVVKKYPAGVPEELKFRNPPPGYTVEARRAFAAGVRAGGNPANRMLPVSFGIHNAYRGLPDSSSSLNYNGTQPREITKTVVNWFNDYPVTIGGMDRINRKQLFCEAKLKTLQWIYYMQHDLAEPLWAVANDEGYDTPFNREENLCANIPAEFKAIERQFPVMPYLRESRRLIGIHTLTAGEIRREGTPAVAVVNFATSIAIGDYPVDLHGCASDASLEHEFEHTSDRPPGSRGGRFQIPLETLIPADTDGLLTAEKNISQTRLANGATRLQPITMLTGQAAGVLAALAVHARVALREVHPGQVQQVLLKENSALSLIRYEDIPRGHRSWAAVEMVTTHGWIAGGAKTHFKPDEPLTRKDVATIIALRAGLVKGFNTYRPAPRDQSSFTDVPLYHRNSAEIEALVKAGAMAACSQNPPRFCPDHSVTRTEFLSALVSAMKLPSVAVKGGDKPISRAEAAEVLLVTASER